MSLHDQAQRKVSPAQSDIVEYKRSKGVFSFMTQTSENTRETMRAALEAVHSLTIFRGVLDNPIGRAVLTLFHTLVTPEPDALEIAQAYSDAFFVLAHAVQSEEFSSDIPDAWQAYLASAIVDDVNVLSLQAEKYKIDVIGVGIREQAKRDIRTLRQLFTLSAQQVWELTEIIVTSVHPGLHDTWVPWYNLAPTRKARITTPRDTLVQMIVERQNWSTLLEVLIHHWSLHGTGIFARYVVFRWEGRVEGLHGIIHPDPIQLSDLIGYGHEKQRLQTNIKHFLHGFPAHDAILYGAPGTGKSSTVKALAHAYTDTGLRLIEVSKEFVNDLPAIVNEVRDHAPRFLLFIDDLSFEEHETTYKALKVLLEGTVEVRPANVVIYATSNRLNLIRENFADRGKPNEDVHWRDTLDEKASLVARFGLRVTFLTPDQTQYVDIVVGLVQQRGLMLAEEDLRMRAIAWERQHTGRSGRLARQFVDELEAELRTVKD